MSEFPATPLPASLDEIRDAFQFFDSWEDKYRFVIDLGKSLVNMPDAWKTEANLVRGCQSQVWLVARYDADGDQLQLVIDSDAFIVRGLVAIVLAAYQNQSPRQIIGFDIEALFAELALLTHLSASRGNGLRAMVTRVVAAAKLHLV